MKLYLRVVGEKALKLLREPLHGLFLGDTVPVADGCLLHLAATNTEALALHDDIKVHAVDARARVVLETQINVFINSKAKVASGAEVPLLQLVLLDLESTLEDVQRTIAAHCHVAGNLFVTPNAKPTESVPGL